MEAGSGPIGKPLFEPAGVAARRFEAALRDHRAGRLPEAIAGYRHVLSLAPDHASAWINLGVALRASGRADEAVACLRRGVQLKPGDAGVCRSEEHTSELQSLMRSSYAVFCLKKKTKNNKLNIT